MTVTHYYCGSASRHDEKEGTGPISRERAEELKTEAIPRINALYEAGTPFFTKQAIREIQQQINNAISNEEIKTISVKGLDNVLVDFDVEIGRIVSSSYTGGDYIVGNPHFSYESLQSLTRENNFFRNEALYCTMHICHEMERQDKETGNVLPGFVSQPIEVVEDMLKSTIQIWETTESCKRLRTILTAAAKNNDNLRDISKIVGFAFGDISSERKSDSALAPPRSYFQHALLLTLRDVLLQIKGEENSNDSTDKLRCFVQDPSYQDVDDQVLKKSGITILEDPDGFLETDDSTAVLSFAPNVPVRQIVCDIARPALIIWDTVKPEKKTDIVTTDPDSNRLREMVNDSYDMFEFQDYERRFGNVAIYIRRPSAPAAAN